MLDTRQIYPLTDFLRNHKKHIARIEKMKSPAILTVNGKAALVVQDAETYQELVELAERAKYVEAIREGLAPAKRGDGKDAEQIFNDMTERAAAAESGELKC
jgi:PHD/YefM family antitoxin component YafN of YafNO toxin-antitoxin module